MFQPRIFQRVKMPRLRITIIAAVAAVQAVLLPFPPGPYGVGLRVQDYIDESRLDPYAPKNDSHHRRVLISAFLPIEKEKCQTEAVSYMPPQTAAERDRQLAGLGLPNTTFSSLQMQLCKLSSDNCSVRGHRKPKYPLVLFSPGMLNSRHLYSTGARALASQGYVVVTIDHSYEPPLVEFPDGSVIYNTTFDLNQPNVLEQAVKVRADDVSFILNKLHNPSALAKLTKGFYGQVDLKRVLAYGHSLGGVTAAKAMLQDKRIIGGMNVDGHMYEPVVVRTGLDKPFLMLGTPKHYEVPESNWSEFYGNLRSSKMVLGVSNTTHSSFTDGPLLLTGAAIPDQLKPVLDEMLGSIDALHLQNITVDIMGGLADLAFNGNGSKLRNIGKFPEVSIEHQSLPKDHY